MLAFIFCLVLVLGIVLVMIPILAYKISVWNCARKSARRTEDVLLEPKESAWVAFGIGLLVIIICFVTGLFGVKKAETPVLLSTKAVSDEEFLLYYLEGGADEIFLLDGEMSPTEHDFIELVGVQKQVEYRVFLVVGGKIAVPGEYDERIVRLYLTKESAKLYKPME